MTSDQTIEVESKSSGENLFRYVGMSVVLYYFMMLLFTVSTYLFTNEFSWDLNFLLYFWMAFSIRSGSKTACKWGVFLISIHGCIFAVICYMCIFNPAAVLFDNRIVSSANLPVVFIVLLLYTLWSVINVIFLVRLLKLHQVRFWTKAPILGCSIIACLLIGSWVVPTIILNSEDYSKASIETQYAEVIEHLIKIQCEDLTRSMNTPQVQALSKAYPEIILAAIKTSRRGSSHIISKKDFKTTSTLVGKMGSGRDSQDNKVKYVIYEDYVKDKDGDWFKIVLWIVRSVD